MDSAISGVLNPADKPGDCAARGLYGCAHGFKIQQNHHSLNQIIYARADVFFKLLGIQFNINPSAHSKMAAPKQESNIMATLPTFTLPAPEDQVDQKLLADIDKFGWHVIGIEGGDDSPGFAFSIGFYYQYQHPEMLIMGLPNDTAHTILASIHEMLAAGGSIEPWRAVDDVASFPLMAIPIGFNHYREHLGYAMWFYRSLGAPFPALQLVWPDRAGVFPWQEGYDQQYFQLQRVLSEEPAP
ncbi:MAG: hypothetical protein RL748_2135 [Pseudomonadota bacterium]